MYGEETPSPGIDKSVRTTMSAKNMEKEKTNMAKGTGSLNPKLGSGLLNLEDRHFNNKEEFLEWWKTQRTRLNDHHDVELVNFKRPRRNFFVSNFKRNEGSSFIFHKLRFNDFLRSARNPFAVQHGNTYTCPPHISDLMYWNAPFLALHSICSSWWCLHCVDLCDQRDLPIWVEFRQQVERIYTSYVDELKHLIVLMESESVEWYDFDMFLIHCQLSITRLKGLLRANLRPNVICGERAVKAFEEAEDDFDREMAFKELKASYRPKIVCSRAWMDSLEELDTNQLVAYQLVCFCKAYYGGIVDNDDIDIPTRKQILIRLLRGCISWNPGPTDYSMIKQEAWLPTLDPHNLRLRILQSTDVGNVWIHKHKKRRRRGPLGRLTYGRFPKRRPFYLGDYHWKFQRGFRKQVRRYERSAFIQQREVYAFGDDWVDSQPPRTLEAKWKRIQDVVQKPLEVNVKEQEIELPQISKRQKGKKRSAQLDYLKLWETQTTRKDAIGSGYRGDLFSDLNSLHEHWKQSRYVPGEIDDVPANLVRSAIRNWIDGYSMRSYFALKSDNEKNLRDFGVPLQNSVPEYNFSKRVGKVIRERLVWYYSFFYKNPMADMCKLRIHAHASDNDDKSLADKMIEKGEDIKSVLLRAKNRFTGLPTEDPHDTKANLERIRVERLKKFQQEEQKMAQVTKTVEVEKPGFTASYSTTTSVPVPSSAPAKREETFVSGVAGQVADVFVDKINTAFDAKASKVDATAEAAGRAAVRGGIDELKKTFFEVFENVKSGMKSGLGKAWEWIKLNKTIIIGFCIIALLGLLGWAAIRTLIPYFTQKPESAQILTGTLEEDVVRVEAHGLTEIMDWIGDSTANLFSLTPVTKFSQSTFVANTIKLGNFAGAVNKLESFVFWFKDMLKNLMDWVCKWWTGAYMFKSTQELQQFHDSWTTLVTQIKQMDVASLEGKREYIRLYDRMVGFTKFLDTFKDRHYITDLKTTAALGKEKYTMCRNAVKFDNIRQQPTSILFPGAPGIGKTTFIQYAVQGLYDNLNQNYPTVWKGIGQDQWTEALIYPRNAAQEFWDKYSNQWAVIVDDIFKSTDPFIRGTEAQEWIAMKNDAPFSPPMAALEEKSDVIFDSKFVVATTNMKSFTDIGLTDPEAFLRRMDFTVKIIENKKVPANVGTIKALETYVFDVYETDMSTFAAKQPIRLKGIDGFRKFMRMVTERYVAYYEAQNRRTTPLEFGKILANNVGEDEEERPTEVEQDESHEEQIMCGVSMVDGTVCDSSDFNITIRHGEECVQCLQCGAVRIKVQAHMFERAKRFGNFALKAGKLALAIGNRYGQAFYAGARDIPDGVIAPHNPPIGAPSMIAQQPLLGFRAWCRTNNIQIPEFRFWRTDKATGEPTEEWFAVARRILGINGPLVGRTGFNYCCQYYLDKALFLHDFDLLQDAPVLEKEVDGKMQRSQSYSNFFTLEAARSELIVPSIPTYNLEFQYCLSDAITGIPLKGDIYEGAKEFLNRSHKNVFERLMQCDGHKGLVCGWHSNHPDAQLARNHLRLNQVGQWIPSWFPRFFDRDNIPMDTIMTWYHGQDYLIDSPRKENDYSMKPTEMLHHAGKATFVTSLSIAAFFSYFAAVVALTAVLTLFAYGLVTFLGMIGVISDKKKSKYVQAHSDDKHQMRLRTVLKTKRNASVRSHAAEEPKKEEVVEEIAVHTESHLLSDSAADGLQKRIAYNTHWIILYEGEKPVRDGAILFTHDRVFAMPHHYLLDIKPTKIEILTTLTKKRTFNTYVAQFSDLIVDKYPQRDLALFWMPDIMPKKSLMRHMRSNADKSLDGISGFSRVQIDTTDDETIDTMKIVYTNDMASEFRNGFVAYSTLPSTYPTREIKLTEGYYISSLPSEAGLCGMGIYCSNNAVEKKFVGINTGGGDKSATVATIFKEDIDKLMSRVEEVCVRTESHIRPTFTESIFPPMAELELKEDYGTYNGMKCWGELNKEFSWPTKTQLKPTVIATGTSTMQPPYPVTEAPAKLRAEGDKDPCDLSFRKMNGKKSYYDPVLMDDRVWSGIFNETMAKCKPRLLSLEESILGIQEFGNFHAIDFTTSAGFPWIGKGLKRTDLIKRDYPRSNVRNNVPAWYNDDSVALDKPPTVDQFKACAAEPGLWVHPELQYMFYIRMWYAKQGLCVPNYVLFCLKDEKRPIARVEKFYTRGFKGSSLDHLLFSRAVFGMFVHILETSVMGDSMLGVNTYSQDWRRIRMKLLRIGRKIISQDVDGWDLNFPVNIFVPGFLYKFARFFGLNRNNRYYLCVEVVTVTTLAPFVVIRRKVYVVLEMPSGTYLTSVLNTICNSSSHRGMWYQLTDKEFDELNALGAFGDDSNLAISEEGLLIWNGQIIAKLAKILFNHTRTAQDKTDNIKPYEDIDEVVMLQRKYVERDGAVLCPLSEESLYSMVQWVQKSKVNTLEKQFAVNCHNALREWAYHGREKFEHHKEILNRFLRVVNPCFVYAETYEQRLDWIVKASSQ